MRGGEHPQRSDVYGALAPGVPLVAAELARGLGHINGYAEGSDGAVFVSGMISLAFLRVIHTRLSGRLPP